MKRIALGIDCWYPQVDGVTNVVTNYHRQLSKENECVTIAPSYGKKQDEEGEREYFAEVFHNKSLKVPFIGFRNSIPSKDKKLKKMLDGFKPEILHTHSPFAISAFFSKYGKKHGIPVVYTFHTKYKDDIKRVSHSRLITAIMMSCIRRNILRADYVWAVSEYAANILRTYGYSGNIRVMPNATDMKPHSPEERKKLAATIDEKFGLDEKEIILMYVGRVVKVKNLGFSFRTLSLLKKSGFKCRMMVVGGGDIKLHKKMAKHAGVEEDVIFTGPVFSREQLTAYYSRANLFLMPSTFDTYGLVVVEAGVCGTPALVAENSSSSEMIEDGVSGYVEELDENKWANRIMEIFKGGTEVHVDSRSIGVSWETRIEEVNAAYEEVIADYNSRHGREL